MRTRSRKNDKREKEQIKAQRRNAVDQGGVYAAKDIVKDKQRWVLSSRAAKDFTTSQLNALTNGKIGEDSETDLISEPVESPPKRCSVCENIERKRHQKNKIDVVE